MNVTAASFLFMFYQLELQMELHIKKTRGATLGPSTSSSRSMAVSFPRRESRTSYEESRGVATIEATKMEPQGQINYNVLL